MKLAAKAFAIALLALAPLASTASTVVIGGGAPTPLPTNFIEPIVSIGNGAEVTSSKSLAPGDTVQFRYEATERFSITGFVIAATGSNFSDLFDLRFDLTTPPGQSLDSIVALANNFTGNGSLSSLILNKGQMFSLFFAADASNIGPVGVTANFKTTVVPIPAALPLLLGGIAALGAVARKKKLAV